MHGNWRNIIFSGTDIACGYIASSGTDIACLKQQSASCYASIVKSIKVSQKFNKYSFSILASYCLYSSQEYSVICNGIVIRLIKLTNKYSYSIHRFPFSKNNYYISESIPSMNQKYY